MTNIFGKKICHFSSILHTRPEGSFQNVNQLMSLPYFLNLLMTSYYTQDPIQTSKPAKASITQPATAYSVTSLSRGSFVLVHNIPDSLTFFFLLKKFQSLVLAVFSGKDTFSLDLHIAAFFPSFCCLPFKCKLRERRDIICIAFLYPHLEQ